MAPLSIAVPAFFSCEVVKILAAAPTVFNP